MTGTNGLTAEVTGLKNTYVTSGTVSNDGKRLTLTRNDNQTFDVDISKISNGLSKTDYRLIANPAHGSNTKPSQSSFRIPFFNLTSTATGTGMRCG